MIPPEPSEDAYTLNFDGSWDGLMGALEASHGHEVALDDNATIWVNASGKLLGLPLNERATAFTGTYRPGFDRTDSLHGPAVIVGKYDEDGFQGVPDHVIKRYESF